VPDLASAIALANAHELGNCVSLFTSDGGAARVFSRQIQAGMVGIDVPSPVPVAWHSFGGWKRSLFGDHHAYGQEAVRFYRRYKRSCSAGPTAWPKVRNSRCPWPSKPTRWKGCSLSPSSFSKSFSIVRTTVSSPFWIFIQKRFDLTLQLELGMRRENAAAAKGMRCSSNRGFPALEDEVYRVFLQPIGAGNEIAWICAALFSVLGPDLHPPFQEKRMPGLFSPIVTDGCVTQRGREFGPDKPGLCSDLKPVNRPRVSTADLPWVRTSLLVKSSIGEQPRR
jgi:hypothetical protein